VNLRTAKIQLLMLLNDRTPIEKFDVTGPFDFTDELRPLEEFRNIALEARPDLKAAVQNVELAKITTSWPLPTARPIRRSACGGRTIPRSNPYDYNTMGASVSFPAHLRPESGRESAHSDRHRPQRAIAGRQRGAGLQRRRFRLLDDGPKRESSEAVQAKYLPLATDVRDKCPFPIRTEARLCWITWMRRKLIGTLDWPI
jgi:hypothetical protein